MRRVDCLIIGQGIAGTTLAWALRERGASVFVVDREEAVTSSKIAAGLMTSVTGQRLVPSWRWPEFWPAAAAFYRGVAREVGAALFHPGPMVRLLRTETERTSLERRLSGSEGGLFRPLAGPLRSDWFVETDSAIELPEGGRLDVSRYLEEVRTVLKQEEAYARCTLTVRDELVPNNEGVSLPDLGVSADRVVFCEGFAARANPWLAGLRFNPARGEILSVRIPGLDEDRVIHGGIWLARQAGEIYRAGATYDWKELDAGPTTAGREELETKLRGLLRLPFEVLGHDAAVRPILHHLPPVAGFLPDNPRIGCFNGLGSKGALQAPFFARQLTEHILFGTAIDAEVDPARRKDFVGG